MRHAIYFAPSEGHVLHRLGSAWLGRDALAGADCPPVPAPEPALPEREALTAAPRRYGLHATLKPPFALAPGRTAAELAAATAALAARLAPVTIRLRLGGIEGFFALLPVEPAPPGLQALAAACVADLDAFRAPPGAAELARRRGASLTETQEAMLQRWGYPYVMGEFRFHITLTGRVAAARAPAVAAVLERHFAPVLGEPLTVGALSLFVERAPCETFVRSACFPLGAAAEDRRAASCPEFPHA